MEHTKKRIFIRWERILLIPCLIYSLINLSRAETSLLFVAIPCHILIWVMVYSGVYFTRKEIQKNEKNL